ncbi:MAG TPA: PEP-CTERM sorting domain-containing protein [Pirellulales bacterium]
MKMLRCCSAALLSFLCLSFLLPQKASCAYILAITSTPGDYIGKGKDYVLTPADGFTFEADSEFGHAISFYVDSNNSEWVLDIAAPHGQQLTVGSYPNASRWPFEPSSQPGLAFAGNGSGLNTSVGSFNVLEADFDSQGNVLRFAVDFIQYDGTPEQPYWAEGSLRYNSDIPVPEPATLLLIVMAAAGCEWFRRRHHRG